MFNHAARTADRRAARGAALLDRTYGPGNWEPKVNPKILDIRSGFHCVVAQAADYNFTRGMIRIWRETGVSLQTEGLSHYGFNASRARQAQQEQAWVELIDKRLNHRKLVEAHQKAEQKALKEHVLAA